MSVDLEALKPLHLTNCNLNFVAYPPFCNCLMPAIIGTLERGAEERADLLNKLTVAERERDGWRAEISRLQGVQRQALAERDDEIQRLNAGVDTFRQRAERVEAAAREWLDNEDRLDAQVAIHSSMKAGNEAKAKLRAALAPAPKDSGVAFERYLAERFPTPEARAELDAKVEEINRQAPVPEGSDG